MKGSVAEAAIVAQIANAQPAREAEKYGQTRDILRSRLDFPGMPGRWLITLGSCLRAQQLP